MGQIAKEKAAVVAWTAISAVPTITAPVVIKNDIW